MKITILTVAMIICAVAVLVALMARRFDAATFFLVNFWFIRRDGLLELKRLENEQHTP